MKKYKLIARSISYLDKVIEAESEEQAWQIANEMDGDEFSYSFATDWDIYSVTETTKGE